jgi:hypothetical protein
LLIWLGELPLNQMVRIDENQEAIALIRMAIDNDNKAWALQAQENVNDHGEVDSGKPESRLHGPERHWIFGSPHRTSSGTRVESRELEKIFVPTNHDFVSFDQRLRSFITHCFPEDAPRYEDMIYVCLSQSNSCLLLIDLFRSRFSNALRFYTSRWRTGPRVPISCVVTRIFISVNDTTALSSMMTILVPPLSASIHYYDANCHLERWLIWR